MRRNWLAKAALASVALSVPMASVAGTAQATTQGAVGQQKVIFHKAQKKKHKSQVATAEEAQ